MKKPAKPGIRAALFSSEIYPFSKTGGLADVCGALPVYLKKEGVETIAFTPLYRSVDREKWQIKKSGEREILFGGKPLTAGFYRTKHRGVTFIFIENDEFFDREFIYGSAEVGYEDNIQRFAFFILASLEWLVWKKIPVDIIHGHDWQAALASLYIKTGIGGDFFKNTRVLLTIHNLRHQGLGEPTVLNKISLSPALFSMSNLEFYGLVNILKGGIIFSDGVNTVSPRYAEEIQTREFGERLEGVLTDHERKLTGILNGIDYKIWNPMTGDDVPFKYFKSNLSMKSQNKNHLLNEFKLKAREDAPLFAFLARLDSQKGIELVLDAIPLLARVGSPLIINGVGRAHYHQIIRDAARRHPKLIAAALRFEESLATRIYAGADFLLVPSRYEPCGLSQMIAMRFGTIPVARNVGGLADTVLDYFYLPPKTGLKPPVIPPEFAKKKEIEGWGISFDRFDQVSFDSAIFRALYLYSDQNLYGRLQKRCMSIDFSYERAAGEYTALYRKLLSAPSVKKVSLDILRRES